MRGASFPFLFASQLFVFACLVACDSRPNSSPPSIDGDAPIAAAVTEVATSIALAGNAELALGDEAFDFGSVTCVGTSMATAVAADRANRDGYPTVRLGTYDPALTGGVNSNTASIQFRGSTRNELWLLHEGDVEKQDDVFVASGKLKGKRMQTQPDGKLKSQPFDGDDIKSFRVRIECWHGNAATTLNFHIHANRTYRRTHARFL